MRWFWLIPACLMLLPVTASADNIHACMVDGKMIFVNESSPYYKRCKRRKLVLPGEKTRPLPVTASAGPNSGTGKKKKKDKRLENWRPPQAMQFNDKRASDQEKHKSIDLIIKKASETYNIPEAFIKGVIEVESSYKVKALSHKGAMGLMQLMPGTARDMGVTNPWDPYQNIMGGTRFLRYLANRFNGDIPKVIAAYHAGGGSVNKAGGIPFIGSDGYVRKVLDRYYRNRDATLASQ